MVRFSSRRNRRATDIIRLRRLMISIKKVLGLRSLVFAFNKDQRSKTKDQKRTRGGYLKSLRTFTSELQFFRGLIRQAITLVIAGIGSVAHVFRPTSNGVRDRLTQVGVLAHETRQL